MKFTVLTLFPDLIEGAMNTSICGRAIAKGVLQLETCDIRDYTENRNRRVDDYPYGGGAGMLMQAQPVYDAYVAMAGKKLEEGKKPRTVFLTPAGKVFDQAKAEELAKEDEVIFLCGHYEGIDERVIEEIVTDEISIGDYVLTGGELASLVVMDAVARMVPGVLGNETSAGTESFTDGLLEYPQYTRPEEWRGKKVPEVLLSGHHANIERWRREQSIQRTRERRPDLLEKKSEQ
ncbi:MAG: tRNA (guanosine(37)-N1)-methyltransferase TrmD [Lachnospiraceae bacterium]|nr:tRNA (guanosine(37)-N1)-methyltransferase TrmD [Lachnospiraceae bacterium]